MDIAQSEQMPAENTVSQFILVHTFLPLVIAETTENIKRGPQVSESPILPKLNLFYTSKRI